MPEECVVIFPALFSHLVRWLVGGPTNHALCKPNCKKFQVYAYLFDVSTTTARRVIYIDVAEIKKEY